MLVSFISKYQEVESQIQRKSEELENLQSENNRLRTRLRCETEMRESAESKQQSLPKQQVDSRHENPSTSIQSNTRKGTLLMGSSVIQEITKKNFILDNDPVCKRGGRATDLTAELLSMPDNESYESIILQVGSNDCVNPFFSEE